MLWGRFGASRIGLGLRRARILFLIMKWTMRPLVKEFQLEEEVFQESRGTLPKCLGVPL